MSEHASRELGRVAPAVRPAAACSVSSLVRRLTAVFTLLSVLLGTPGSARATKNRIRKTRGLLHGALAALVHEKPLDTIVVKEILGRASVGRSTFYAHFRDADLVGSGPASASNAGHASSAPNP